MKYRDSSVIYSVVQSSPFGSKIGVPSMRINKCVLLFSLIVCELSADQQLYWVTPQTLDSWSLVGASQQVLATGSRLTLPAASQLVRNFRSADIAAKITTQPVIGVDPSDWPVLEIGSAAIVLARKGTEGKAFLVLGDLAPMELNCQFSLDATGRSAGIITVGLRHQSERVEVEMSGQKIQFPVALSEGDSWEVVASAGGTSDWEMDSFIVSVQNETSTAVAPNASAGLRQEAEIALLPNGTVTGINASGASIQPGTSAATEQSSGEQSTSWSVPGRKSASLEVYTPPATRHGRATAAAEAVAKAIQK
jgi:hypothetical protein